MSLMSVTIFYFFIYAILGWVCEVVYCSVLDGKLQNRGFLYGPFCPIYGFGALIILKILLPLVRDPILLFFAAVIACTVLEYMTSWVMEKAFHLRWWDYSKNKFNINGRVCLLNSMLFGILGLVLIYGIHPFFERAVDKVPAQLGDVIGLGIAIGMAFDFILSVFSVLRTSQHLAALEQAFEAYRTEQKLKVQAHKVEWENFVEELHKKREAKNAKIKSSLAEKLSHELERFDMHNQKLRRIIKNQSHMKLHRLGPMLALLSAYKK